MKRLILALALFTACGLSAQHKLPPLPYAENALEPVMSAETIRYHHGKHVKAYVDKLNQLVPGTPYQNSTIASITREADGEIFNNGAQILNHIIFFDGFAPEAIAQHTPTGVLADAIDRDFGSFDGFMKLFADAAAKQFGSGWVWLTKDSTGKLAIIPMSNAGNPLQQGLCPILGIDVWEHSYYIDYRNERARYMENLWRIIDWRVIGGRYDSPCPYL